MRQLLTESVLLGAAGGALGLIVAKAGTTWVLAALPEALPRADEIGMDWHVLCFTAGLSVLTGVLFGLAPALKLLRPKLNETLKEGGRGSSGNRHRLQSVLVAAEMAMALVLLVGAGLMIRSLAALWEVNPGFETENVLSFGLSLTAQSGASADQLRAKYRESLRQFESVPGIEKISMIGGSLPMSGDSEVPFWLEGQPKPAHQADTPFSLFYLVTPAYQAAMRIPLQRGRFISDQDDEHSAPVVVIDASFARKYYPNEDPVGKYLNIGLLNMHPQIVGVVGHVEHWGLGDGGHQALQVQLYLPVWQVPDQFWPLLSSGSGYVARTAASADVLGGLRTAAAAASTPIRNIRRSESSCASPATRWSAHSACMKPRSTISTRSAARITRTCRGRSRVRSEWALLKTIKLIVTALIAPRMSPTPRSLLFVSDWITKGAQNE